MTAYERKKVREAIRLLNKPMSKDHWGPAIFALQDALRGQRKAPRKRKAVANLTAKDVRSMFAAMDLSEDMRQAKIPNCQVCGRKLNSEDEQEMGMCEACANLECERQ
jgi:hypothetical protein